jgi:hypothetical protein
MRPRPLRHRCEGAQHRGDSRSLKRTARLLNRRGVPVQREALKPSDSDNVRVFTLGLQTHVGPQTEAKVHLKTEDPVGALQEHAIV